MTAMPADGPRAASRRARGGRPLSEDELARMDDHAERVVAAMPPLSQEQLDLLALVFTRDGRPQARHAPRPRRRHGSR
jgi:hypothetical protein